MVGCAERAKEGRNVTTTADLGVDEVVTVKTDEIVAQALRDADTDLESLRAHAAAGRFRAPASRLVRRERSRSRLNPKDSCGG